MDNPRININDEYEVRYWTGVLGVSREKLRAAIKAVGPTADAVRRQLKRARQR